MLSLIETGTTDGDRSLYLKIARDFVLNMKSLFHYTTQAGLLGIIENKSLWFTNIFYLNDASEFEYTFRLMQDELKKRNVNEALKFTKDIFIYERILESVKSSFYVFSFSINDDDLSQWRAYGDDGGGYCIEFDFEQTVKVSDKIELLRKECLYNPEKQREEINKIIDEIFASCKNNGFIELIQTKRQELSETGSTDSEKLEEIKGKFIRQLLVLALGFKDPAFEGESERRMYTVAGKDEVMPLKFRQGKKMLIPYLDIEIAKVDGMMPIRRIVIGPTNHSKLSIIAVENLLMANSINCKVTLSKIPYRAKL